MDLRTADAGRGAAWLFDGFEYFKKDAGAWIGATLILAVLFVIAHGTIIGVPFLLLFGPAFIGGLMLGCKAVDEGRSLDLGSLFAGFSNHAGGLLGLGLLHLIAASIINVVVIVLLIVLVGSSTLIALAQEPDALQALTMITGMLGGVAVALLVGAALYLPVMMAFWFAPALVVLANVPVMEALSQSFKGCLVNVVPFLLYGIVGLVLCLLASIPLMLGWLILFPMIVASLYVSYKEIYLPPVAAVAA